MLIVVEIGQGFQNLDDAVCLSHSANPSEMYESNYSPFYYRQVLGHTGPSNLDMAADLEAG